jgi:hypothetical protein
MKQRCVLLHVILVRWLLRRVGWTRGCFAEIQTLPTWVDTTSKTIILNQTTGSMVHTSYNKCLGVYTRVEEEEEEEEEGSTPGRDMR